MQRRFRTSAWMTWSGGIVCELLEVHRERAQCRFDREPDLHGGRSTSSGVVRWHRPFISEALGEAPCLPAVCTLSTFADLTDCR
jgi:hypothetical protein